MISIIIPANNEEHYIGACLENVLKSEDLPFSIEVIVIANGCTDNTFAVAASMKALFNKKGWSLRVLNLTKGSKTKALNYGDSEARFGSRIYLDADVCVSSKLISETAHLLDLKTPIYASGQITVPKAKSSISQRYATFWQRLPFVADAVPGCGFFGVNYLGRSRWDEFPPVISDDMFARIHFRDDEMRKSLAEYRWPIAEGFTNLVKVRRRQDAGLKELKRHFPDLMNNTKSTFPNIGRTFHLLLSDPIGFTIYSLVSITVRLPVLGAEQRWYRGR